MIHTLKQSLTKLRSTVHELKKSTLRSPRWNQVRDEYLALHSECEACGSKKSLQVHHVKPFHLYPDLELDTSNFITLCMDADLDCHLHLGHGGSFRCYNPNVRSDVAEFKETPTVRALIISEAKRNRKDS